MMNKINLKNSKLVFGMEKDYCVKCGSENIKTVKKSLGFKLSNPRAVRIEQECEECQDCSDTYLTKEQIKELSGKINLKIKK